jgi:uncharacterized repeat protein (TIGR03803 family)
MLAGCRWTAVLLRAVLLCLPPVAAVAAPLGQPVETSLYLFKGKPDAGNPRGTLVADASGTLYGPTLAGGADDDGKTSLGVWGAIFAVAPPQRGFAERVIYSFQGGGDGWSPHGKLAVGHGGVLFGGTTEGGSGGYGTVFSLTPSAAGYVHRVVYAFSGGADGSGPLGGLIRGAGDTYYGTTAGGGLTACIGGCGTVFRIARQGRRYVETVLYAFAGGADGERPKSDIVADRDGDLFGTTEIGGGSRLCNGGCGTAFELARTTTGYSERVLYAFAGGADGEYPEATLLIGPRGTLYGTTNQGGGTTCNSGTGCGTAFALTPGPGRYTETLIHRFLLNGDLTDGYFPNAELVAGPDGTLYSTTLAGGFQNSYGFGTVFALTPSGGGFVETILHPFAAGADGANPYNGLAIARLPAGFMLVGTTSRDGDMTGCQDAGCGTVFGVTP